MSAGSPLGRYLRGEDAGKPNSLPLKYFYNGNIRTLEPNHPWAPHMLVAGERIWFCCDQRAPLGLDFRESGFDHQRKLLADQVECIDLGGRTVMPGFIDAHVHFLWWALTMTRPDLSGARSEAQAVETLLSRTTHVAPGEWILGHGWSHNTWPGATLPSKASLDAAFPHNPVFLTSKCGHLAWLNSRALRLLGITPSTPDPPGGAIYRREVDGNVELTGILAEDAVGRAEAALPPPSLPTKRQAFVQAQLRAHALGIVAIHTPEDLDTFDFYQQMHSDGLLRLRVAFYAPAADLDALLATRLRYGFGDDWLFLAGVKIFADGSLGGRTAWLYHPYENEPDSVGTPVRTFEEILALTIRANRAGLPVATHAIGDRAVGEVLRAYELAAAETGSMGATGTRPLVRNRVEHLQLIAPQDFDLIRSVRPIASVQPVHLCTDWRPADLHWGKRARYAYALRTLAQCACPLAFGSDAPVEPIEPWWGIHAAVNRCDLQGQPPHGWYPEERLDLEQAIASYTLGGAVACGRNRSLGSLKPGKLADFIVLDQDPWQVAPTQLRNLSVLQTYVAGECVYKQPHD